MFNKFLKCYVVFPYANRVDPDQTALTRAVWSGSDLFAKATARSALFAKA